MGERIRERLWRRRTRCMKGSVSSFGTVAVQFQNVPLWGMVGAASNFGKVF